MASFSVSSTEFPLWIESKEAGGTITEGAVVKLNSDYDSVVVCTAETDAPYGVARHAAASGDRVSVIKAGRANVMIVGAATVTMGIPAIVNGANGYAINWTAESPAWSIGQWADTRTAGASGSMCPVNLNIYKIKP